MNLSAGRGVAVREFKLTTGHGFADYLLFVDGKAVGDTKPSSFRARLRAMPPVEKAFLFPNQLQAVINLEHSLFRNRPRALVQMATGSGKTIMAVTAAYRLIKFGGARRVLFLVDR